MAKEKQLMARPEPTSGKGRVGKAPDGKRSKWLLYSNQCSVAYFKLN
jgi:hypothetical protein